MSLSYTFTSNTDLSDRINVLADVLPSVQVERMFDGTCYRPLVEILPPTILSRTTADCTGASEEKQLILPLKHDRDTLAPNADY